jgi:hypothetical protein
MPQHSTTPHCIPEQQYIFSRLLHSHDVTCQQLLGPPSAIATTATLGTVSGVDEEAAFILTHPSGALSMLSSAITVDTQQV